MATTVSAAPNGAPTRSCTVVAPTNLALIKYWGKRDTELNLPINSSVSVTLDSNDLRTVTTAALGEPGEPDRLYLNGRLETELASRAVTVIKLMRTLCKPEDANKSITLFSENSFPTAAGLASSAAGYAAMVAALAGVYEIVPLKDGEIDAEAATKLSEIARRGSGSACRSMLGGVVAWHMGDPATNESAASRAERIAEPQQFSSLQAVVLVASDKKKHVSSTAGMQTSVKTSLLLKHRAAAVVPDRFQRMLQAVRANSGTSEMKTILELTMQDSNQFHACCLDTYPPIFYMTDTSRAVVRLVDELNGLDTPNPDVRYAYTFDAGPNAVVFCDAAHVQALLDRVLKEFPPSTAGPELFVRGRTQLTRAQVKKANRTTAAAHPDELMYVFHTGIGKGPRIVTNEEELSSIAPKKHLEKPESARVKRAKVG